MTEQQLICLHFNIIMLNVIGQINSQYNPTDTFGRTVFVKKDLSQLL
jgi:hypothetical protein